MAKATAAPAAEFPTVSIIERRIASGDANQRRLTQLHLVKQPEPMAVRMFNCGITGRFYDATTHLGWVPITEAEVGGGVKGDLAVMDGLVVSGEKGEGVWMKMPARMYTKLQRSKADKLDADLKSRTRLIGRMRDGMEREAKGADRAGASALDRQASRLDQLEVTEFNVTREQVPIGPQE